MCIFFRGTSVGFGGVSSRRSSRIAGARSSITTLATSGFRSSANPWRCIAWFAKEGFGLATLADIAHDRTL